MENSLERWHKHKTFENVHQSTARCMLRQSHDMYDLYGKTMKPNLTLLHQSRSDEVKNPADLTGDGKSFLHANNEKFHPKIKFPENRKLISTKSQFIRHQKTQKIDKPHVCNECGKAFIKKSQSQHLLFHYYHTYIPNISSQHLSPSKRHTMYLLIWSVFCFLILEWKLLLYFYAFFSLLLHYVIKK